MVGLLVAVAWLILAVVCGYPVVCLLRTIGKGGLKLDYIELLFVSALAGSLVIGWLGLLVAELGLFSLPTLAVGMVAVVVGSLVGLWARRGTLAPLVRKPSPAAWLIVPLVGMALVAFFHPAEFVLGGGDAGVYVNVGANIANTGSLLIHEEGLADLSAGVWPGLFRQTGPTSAVQYVRLPGFYLADDVAGLVVPQFFPLHPVWLATCNALLGLRASLYATPVWAALGVLAVSLAVKRAFDMRIGLLAAFLLLVTPTQVYFARYPTAEPLTQFLIWAGLYCFVAFTMGDEPMWGVLSGLALGQVFLARVDALPLLLLPLAWLVHVMVRRRPWRRQLWFFLPLAAMLLHALLHGVFFSWPYVWEVYGHLWRLGLRYLGQTWWILIGAAVCGIALAWAARRLRMGAMQGERALRWSAAAAVLAMGLFAYFVWPRTGEVTLAQYWYGGVSIPIMNHLNLVRAAWYLSPLGVWLGIAGVALMLLRGDGRRMWPLVATGLTFSVGYLFNIMNNPFHIYATRRYVPVVFPFFAIGMAYALVWLWEQRHRWRPAGVAAWVLGLSLVAWLIYNNRVVWNLAELRGLVQQVDALAGQLEPGAVLLFDDDVPVGVGATIGTPLQYLHGFIAFDLQEEHLDPEALVEGVGLWQDEGRTVYWVRGPEASYDLPDELSLTPVMERLIAVPYLEGSYDHFPTQVLEFRAPLQLYQLVLEKPVPTSDAPAEAGVVLRDPPR
ncbi:MAG: glycosyltransferase family 39 protein [Anaerolineae bacterium]